MSSIRKIDQTQKALTAVVNALKGLSRDQHYSVLNAAAALLEIRPAQRIAPAPDVAAQAGGGVDAGS